MSLSLHQRLLHESAGATPALPRRLRLPWRDSAAQQLDALEAANRSLSANRLGGNGVWIGLVAVVLVLAAGTSSWQSAPQAQGVAVASTALLPLPVTVTHEQPLPIVQPEALAAPDRTHAEPEPALAVIYEATQQHAARTRVLTEARRQAARAAQERAQVEKDALRASERRQAERAAEAPPTRAAEPALPVVQLVAHTAPRASVREACNGAGFIGRQMCHARECRKPENGGDAVCVQLREFEQARVRVEQ